MNIPYLFFIVVVQNMRMTHQKNRKFNE